MKFPLLLLVMFTVFFTSGLSKAANLTAYVDNNIVQIGQLVQFSVTLSEKSSSDKPDFSALQQDFDVLSGINTSSQTQIINGSMSSSTTWSVTISPKHDGAIVIPPIKLAGLETEAITVVVGKAPEKKFSDVFFETTVNKKSVYVQEQIRLDLKLYVRMADLSSTQLDDLNITDAKVLPAGEAKQSQILQNGIRYHLVEKSYFIFPEKSGVLKIPSLRFNGVVTEGSRYSRFGTQRRISAKSDAVNVTVKAIPESFPKNAIWLPAEQLIVAETFSPGNHAKVGDPITRTIITKATGLIGAALPPAELKNITDLKVYPDEGNSNEVLTGASVVSTRNDSFALIANKGGDIELPVYRLPWWDTKNDKLQYAQLDGKTLHFTGNQIESSQEELPSDFVIDDSRNDQPQATNKQSVDSKTLWLVISIFALVWLTTIAAFLFYIRTINKTHSNNNLKDQEQNTLRIVSESEKSALNTFEQSCKNNDAHTARSSLIQWARLRFPENNMEGLSSLVHFIEKSSNDEQSELSQQLQALDKMLYTNDTSHLDFQTLRQCFKEWTKDLDQKNEKTEKGKKLSALYAKD